MLVTEGGELLPESNAILYSQQSSVVSDGGHASSRSRARLSEAVAQRDQHGAQLLALVVEPGEQCILRELARDVQQPARSGRIMSRRGTLDESGKNLSERRSVDDIRSLPHLYQSGANVPRPAKAPKKASATGEKTAGRPNSERRGCSPAPFPAELARVRGSRSGNETGTSGRPQAPSEAAGLNRSK